MLLLPKVNYFSFILYIIFGSRFIFVLCCGLICSSFPVLKGYPPKDGYPPAGYPPPGYAQGYPAQGYPPPQYSQAPQQKQQAGMLEGW